MTTPRQILTCCILATGVIVATAQTRASTPPTLPPLTTLSPGGDLVIQQNVTVNVVMIGFDGLVSPATLQSKLTAFNGVPGYKSDLTPYMASRFDFTYNMIDSSTVPWFDDAFFGLLGAYAYQQPPQFLWPGFPNFPMTQDQLIYTFCNVPTAGPFVACDLSPSATRANGFSVQQNYIIDGPFVEKLLANNLGLIFGIDVRNPTVVLVNWYGRPDYIDHVYADAYENNPATGDLRWIYFRNMTAGTGGTNVDDAETCFGDCVDHQRVWFHDISAGPFFDTGSFNVTLPELDLPPFANATPDYRIHHTADYLAAGTPGTYRVINTMADDLAHLVNDTYLSQIAFANPVYRSDIMPPRLPYNLQVDLNRWDWNGSASYLGLMNEPVMLSKFNRLPYTVGLEVNDQPDLRTSRLGDVFNCALTTWGAYGGPPTFSGFPMGQSCYGNRLGGMRGPTCSSTSTRGAISISRAMPTTRFRCFSSSSSLRIRRT